MLIKFARPYFSRSGVHYPAHQLVDVPDDEFQKDGKNYKLPAGARLGEDQNLELPSSGAPALPGYGAKPLHHQALADVGAEPTHLLVEATSAGAAQGAVMTDPNAKESAKTVQSSAAPGAKADTKVASAKDDRSSKDAAKDL